MAGSTDEIPTTPDDDRNIEGPLRKIDSTDAGFMNGLLPGRLVITGECVAQETTADMEKWIMVLWPLDAHWDENSREVIFPDGRRLALGERVALGGGMVRTSDIDGGPWPPGSAISQALATCQSVSSSSVWIASPDFFLIRDVELSTNCGITGATIDGFGGRPRFNLPAREPDHRADGTCRTNPATSP